MAACQDLEGLISELQGSIYRNVPGYDATYFPRSFHETGQRVSSSASLDPRPIPLQSPSEVLEWLDDFQHRQLGTTTHTNFVLRSIKSKHGGASEPTLCLVGDSAPKLDQHCLNADVLVLGLVQTPAAVPTEDEAILRLCDVVAGVFEARPDRRFLHAFRLYSSTMETWTFDRAGAYSGSSFDVIEEPHRFRDVVAAYMSMNDEELGLNSFLQQDDQGIFVELSDPNASAGVRRLSVNDDAFVKHDCLVGPGTTCFKARVPGSANQELVVKFSWSQGEGSFEPGLLQFANKRDVWGVLTLEGYHDLGDIARLRQGLQFNQPYEFSHPRLGAESSGEPQTLPETTLNPSPPATQASSGLADHEKDAKFDNLRFECIVTSPLGRPLHKFSSPTELMTVLRDMVKALRSLYLQANILHRDVSPRNIIIVPNDSQDFDAPTGILIDLDLALDLSHPPSEQRLVGSRGFMAIGILGGDEHTYRHDLESLFYVFLWMAICHDGHTSEHIPETSRLRTWMGADFLTTFHTKRKDMQPAEFSKWAEEEFTERFRPYLPLATTLHHLLFPIKNDKIFIGTDNEPGSAERLYAEMVAAFERHIR